MAPKTGRTSDQFPLRLPAGMREQIANAANAIGRSMNAEIIDRLERSFVENAEALSQAHVANQVEKALNDVQKTLTIVLRASDIIKLKLHHIEKAEAVLKTRKKRDSKLVDDKITRAMKGDAGKEKL